jgi:hypothetical protein
VGAGGQAALGSAPRARRPAGTRAGAPRGGLGCATAGALLWLWAGVQQGAAGCSSAHQGRRAGSGGWGLRAGRWSPLLAAGRGQRQRSAAWGRFAGCCLKPGVVWCQGRGAQGLPPDTHTHLSSRPTHRPSSAAPCPPANPPPTPAPLHRATSSTCSSRTSSTRARRPTSRWRPTPTAQTAPPAPSGEQRLHSPPCTTPLHRGKRAAGGRGASCPSAAKQRSESRSAPLMLPRCRASCACGGGGAKAGRVQAPERGLAPL